MVGDGNQAVRIRGGNRIMRNDPTNSWTSDALERGDIEAIRQRALEDPFYLEWRECFGDSPLQLAISYGNLELIRFLLERGGNPNINVDDGYTCLLTAVESEAPASVAIVATLIAAGADIHQTGTNGWTPLHMAAARGQVEKARLLIEAGVTIDQRTEIEAGYTPLMEAAQCGQAGTAALLLASGADACLRDTIHSRTPLEIAEYAAAGPDLGVFEFLKQQNYRVNVDELLTGVELPPDQLAMLKQQMAKIDMAEGYLEASKRLVASGNHAETIRILREHVAR